MENRTKGAWLIHHASKLSRVTNPLDFESILTAGKAGALLSALSANEQTSMTNETIDAIRRAASITKTEMPGLLQQLGSRGVVSVSSSGVDVLGVTSDTILEHTAGLYDALSPGQRENAALDFAEEVSVRPVDQKTAAEQLSDTHKLAKADAGEFILQCEEIGFVDSESLDASRKLYFNGNIFRRENARKMDAVFSSLKPEEVARLNEVDEELRRHGAMTLDVTKTKLGDGLFEKLHAAGVYDVSEVSNATEQVFYVTRPAAFGKFGNPFTDDALDLAKAFVTCLTYGMTRRSSGTGRITMIKRLLNKLNQGQWVGPATAIGEDYRVLEMKRVIQLNHSHGTQYHMRLLKREIGLLAYEVISLGEAAEAALDIQGAPVSRYRSPEEMRLERRKKQNRESRRGTADILTALRTGGR